MKIDNWHLECPKCGSDEDLMIEIRMWAMVTTAGLELSDAGGAKSWNGKSVCECGECNHSATVEDFKK